MQSSTSAAVASLEDTALIEKTRAFVENYMSAYDGSHDYSHIKRVLALAQHILSVEFQTHPEGHYNPTVVTLGALLHDVGDHKYPAKDIDPLKQVTLVQDTLISLGAPTTLAQAVQKITKNVSFSHEKANEDLVRQVLNEYPELAVVQDADRLDALGAVGVGRAFTYGGAMQRDMQQSIGHITEKREGVEQMMKTEEGKKLAAERINRLRTFRKWFDEEEEFGARDGR
ncbi:MAG: hypothetical protein MMC33_008875 [Icmadophila ericetorum]|nr:hypothetical protein [Icmadophila ericetorum]